MFAQGAKAMRYLFYCFDSHVYIPRGPGFRVPYESTIWRPGLWRLAPSGMPLLPYAAWWALHQLRLFANRDYGLYLVRHGTRLVHYSGIYPGYFRFPFMGKDDLQIGNTWTHPDHRGRGIAALAIQQIVELERRPGRQFWYITEEGNLASVRAVEKVGFVCVGRGIRARRLGLRIMGSFVLNRAGGDGPRAEALRREAVS